jgi:succinate dehydrogenase / fumarate reductase flavoprotein subunit
MTGACRREGIYLRNNQGERFIEKYTPKMMELCPRDIVSPSETTEILKEDNLFEVFVFDRYILSV